MTEAKRTPPWWWTGHSRTYVLIWLALTAALFSSLGIGSLGGTVVGLTGAILIIAIFKASLVVAYFMHLALEPKFLKLLVAGALSVLLALYVGLYPDVVDLGGAAKTSAVSLPLDGKKLFRGTCAICHGAEGQGVEGLGKPLFTSEFVRKHTDQQLLQFVIGGRAAKHPDNTTNVPMPPRGGNPALTDEHIRLIIEHVRTLTGERR